MIELQNVTKLYGTVIGVNDITLTLGQGAHGLLGPNGSGKSTLLNLIVGQLTPTMGTVKAYGHSPKNNAKFFRKLGYCPASEGLYANVSALEWVRYLQELQGMRPAAATKAAEKALDLVGMRHAKDRPISTYSRGMRQRTKLAQAIAHEPDFLILDEPFSGLDPIARHEMSQAMRHWISEGRSLLLASHILHDVESITDSFLLICGGRLLASGTADEVHDMLADLPSEITLVTNRPHDLAAKLIGEEAADTVQVVSQEVIAGTRSPAKLISQLPQWVADHDIEISEMRSSDESLGELFNSLLKIHRGEN